MDNTEAYEQALAKLRGWCDRRERSSKELREKIQTLDLEEQAAESAFIQLVEEKYQDDGRFAESFASGHFRIKKWGRLKIRQGLAQKGIPGSVAAEAMDTVIDNETYMANLKDALRKKGWSESKSIPFNEQQKLLRFAYQRGYEPELIRELISQ